MSPSEQQLMIASGKLISMSQASTLTPYSTEYLSLLARKGRLKAVKISRDWLTTEEAVWNYVREQQTKHQNMLLQLSGNFPRTGMESGFSDYKI